MKASGGRWRRRRHVAICLAICLAASGSLGPSGALAIPCTSGFEPTPRAGQDTGASRIELGQRLGTLLQRAFNTARAADPFELMDETGEIDPALEVFLREASGIVADIERIRPERRAIDLAQGSALLLPHLVPMRHEARASALLARAAGLEGDRATMREHLVRVAMIARDLASDGTVSSSFEARNAAAGFIRGVRAAIDWAHLDQATAAVLGELTREFARPDAFRFADALEGECAMIAADAARLRSLAPESRRNALREWTGRSGADRTPGTPDAPYADDAPYTDEALARDLEVLTDLHRRLGAALANRDRAAARLELERIDADHAREVAKGPVGPLGELGFDPDVAMTALEVLLDLEAAIGEIEPALRDLASGAAAPEERADAAPLYVRAAEAVRLLGPAEQAAIEAMRRIPGEAPEDVAREARLRLEELRPLVIAPVLEAARRGRAGFLKRPRREWVRAVALAERGSIGAIGAMRVVLADSVDPRPRRADEAMAADGAIAVLHAVRLYADAGLLIHSLCAEVMARDLVDALAILEARGEIDAAARERIRRELAGFASGDFFGWRRAAEIQRGDVVRNFHGRLGVQPEALGPVDPNDVLPLLAAALAAPDGCLLVETAPPGGEGACRCEGPLLDLRPHLDHAAILSARAQWIALADAGVPEAERRARLAPTVPIDVRARIAGQPDLFRELARFGDPPARR